MDHKKFLAALERLTSQQWAVLSRVLVGQADSEIATSLNIKQATVRKHIERIYRVFDILTEAEDRRSKRGDLFTLFATYKPEMLAKPGGSVAFLHDVHEYKFQALDTLPNPFIPLTGIVDDPKRFFNREQELQRIFEILNSGSSVAVIGERAIGKSSLLAAICRLAEMKLQSIRQAIYLNLQQVCDEDDFYTALCGEIGIPISKGYRLTRALKEHKLLIAIDETEKMTDEKFTYQLRDQLRALAEGSDSPFRLVLAASQPLYSLFEDEGMTSPLANICIEEKLEPWDEETSSAFIESRLSSTSVTFTKEEEAQIVQESGGYPQRLMQLCHQTYTRYMEQR